MLAVHTLVSVSIIFLHIRQKNEIPIAFAVSQLITDGLYF